LWILPIRYKRIEFLVLLYYNSGSDHWGKAKGCAAGATADFKTGGAAPV